MEADIIIKPSRNMKTRVELLEEEETTDYISDLPDHILYEVFSHLHYDDILRTSCLSKRWRYLWASLPRLRFEMHNMKSLSERNAKGAANQNCYLSSTDARRRRVTRLVNSVYQVLNIRDGPIHGFSLLFDPIKDEKPHPEFVDDSYTWIEMLQSRRVSYMNLDFSENYGRLYDAHASPKYLLPNQLFKFEFLTNLSLRYCCMQLPISDRQCFALKSLRELYLDQVLVTNKEMMEGILPNVPRLERLTLSNCHELTQLHLPCELISLRNLFVTSCFRLDEIKADTPNLEDFTYTGHMIQFSVNKSAPVTNVALLFTSRVVGRNIPESWFEGRPRYDLTSTLHMLPLKFPFVGVLRLCVLAVKVLVTTSEELCIREKQQNPLTYANLKEFQWSISSVHAVDFCYLLNILQSCPSLEKLTVHFVELSSWSCLKTEYKAIFQESNKEIWVPRDFVQLGPIKIINIEGFTAQENQMKLIQFLLQKCTLTLELLTIRPSRHINSWFKATHAAERRDIDACYSIAKMELLCTATKIVSGPFSLKPKVVFFSLDLLPRASTT